MHRTIVKQTTVWRFAMIMLLMLAIMPAFIQSSATDRDFAYVTNSGSFAVLFAKYPNFPPQALSQTVTLEPGDILALQYDLLMKIDPVTAERTDYPDGIICTSRGLAIGPNGDLFTTSNCAPAGVYHIDPATGEQTLISAADGALSGGMADIAVGADSDLFVTVNTDTAGWITRVNPQSGAKSLVSSDFLSPFGIAVAANGDLFITDLGDNTVSRLNPETGIKTTVAQGSLLANLYRAGGIAISDTGDLFVASVDPEPDIETGMVVRVAPETGAQTLVSYGQLLVAGNTGITSIAVEANGNLLVADRRSGFGIIRIDPSTGIQTGMDIGASPIHGLAVVPQPPAQPYDLPGLLDPYGPPDEKKFKAGSVVPLKWQYTNNGVVFNSAEFQPTLSINGPVSCSEGSVGAPITVDAPGNSGLQYLAPDNTWQFNWKTQKNVNGCFTITIEQATLGVTKVFPIRIGN